MIYKLKKLSKNKNNLRTEEVIGNSQTPPTMGESFQLFGKPLDITKSWRDVSTSTILEVVDTDDPDVKIIHTMNSIYEITLLPTLEL